MSKRNSESPTNPQLDCKKKTNKQTSRVQTNKASKSNELTVRLALLETKQVLRDFLPANGLLTLQSHVVKGLASQRAHALIQLRAIERLRVSQARSVNNNNNLSTNSKPAALHTSPVDDNTATRSRHGMLSASRPSRLRQTRYQRKRLSGCGRQQTQPCSRTQQPLPTTAQRCELLPCPQGKGPALNLNIYPGVSLARA